MRNVLCLALLAPILALAAGTTQPATALRPGMSLQTVTVLPGDGKAGPSSPPTGTGPSRAARFAVGTVDTVGGTTYDYQTNGPAYRMLAQTPGKGVHVLFMYSTEADTNFPHRWMRYNFYDFATGVWWWPDPDFMQAGVNVFSERTGYGSMDTDTNGVAVISAHHTTPAGLAPIVARDVDVGAGIFDYSYGEPTIDQHVWPYLGVNANGYYQLAMLENVSQDYLYWGRSTAWQSWDAAVSMPSPQPEPLFPTHNIATSKVSGSNKVCITWVAMPASGFTQNPGFYRESPDGGDNWDSPVDIGFPPAFHPGSDTLPYFHHSALFPFYDRNDNLHIVGNVGPYERDTSWLLPAHGEIWHWCAANPNTWDLVRIAHPVAHPDSFQGNFPSNSMVCCRPSLGEDDSGNLFVTWEEFDGANVEATTNVLRGDVWYSYSTDNGVTWAEGTKLTDGGEVTYRYPSILNPIGDTAMVTYIIDQVAGTFVQGAEGPATDNPVVVQKFYKFPPGIEAPKVIQPSRMEVAASPSPARGRTAISYTLPRSGEVSLVVYDAAGRPVRTLDAGRREAGRYTATWDARDAAAGVYFYTLTSGKASVTRKLILAD